MMGASRLILTSLSPAKNASTPFVKIDVPLHAGVVDQDVQIPEARRPSIGPSAVQSDSFATSQVLT